MDINSPEDPTPKRSMYDSVFCCMARDKKYLLKIFQALHPEDTSTTADDLTLLNAQTALVDDIYNDLSFEANGRAIILVEAQSAWSDNVVLRILMYYVQDLRTRLKDANLYRAKPVWIPDPEFYLIFTGERKEIPKTVSLANIFFAGKSDIDVTAKVIHLPGKHDIIAEYITFCKYYHEEYAKTGRSTETLENTLRRCKEEGILTAFLHDHEHEVKAMYAPLYDQETITRNYINDVAATKYAEGIDKGEDNIYLKMIQKGLPIEVIMDLVDVSREKLESLKMAMNTR